MPYDLRRYAFEIAQFQGVFGQARPGIRGQRARRRGDRDGNARQMDHARYLLHIVRAVGCEDIDIDTGGGTGDLHVGALVAPTMRQSYRARHQIRQHFQGKADASRAGSNIDQLFVLQS